MNKCSVFSQHAAGISSYGLKLSPPRLHCFSVYRPNNTNSSSRSQGLHLQIRFRKVTRINICVHWILIIYHSTSSSSVAECTMLNGIEYAGGDIYQLLITWWTTLPATGHVPEDRIGPGIYSRHTLFLYCCCCCYCWRCGNQLPVALLLTRNLYDCVNYFLFTTETATTIPNQLPHLNWTVNWMHCTWNASVHLDPESFRHNDDHGIKKRPLNPPIGRV